MKGSGTLSVSLLSLFSLYHFKTTGPDRPRKKEKKKKTWEETPSNFYSECLFFILFSPFLQNFLLLFVFVLKICVCIYFLVGFNLWLFANTGLLGFDKKRRFGSILDIFSLHKKQRWEWVKATNTKGWKTRDVISDSKAERTLEFLSPIHTLFAERAKRALPIWMERAFQLLYESKV